MQCCLFAFCVLPPSINRCLFIFSPDIPPTSWWSFCGEWAAISIPIDRNSTNLPTVHNSFVSKNIKRKHAFKFRSALHATGLYAALHYFTNESFDQNCERCLGCRVSFQASLCWKSEEWEPINASEGITPLALEIRDWDAVPTSNDEDLKFQRSFWQVPISTTHHKN